MNLGFLWSLRCLSAVPLGRTQTTEPRYPMTLAFWFPVLGAVLGGLSGTVAFWCAKALPAAAAAVAGLTGHVLLTGGLHLDGLADTADGVFGGWTRERRLEIMRDSQIGTFGVIALVLVLLLKFAALSTLCAHSNPSVVLFSFPAAAMLSRYTMVLSAGLAPYARRGPGTGRSFVGAIGPAHAAVSTLFVIIVFGGLAAVPLAPFDARVWLAAPLLPALVAAALTVLFRAKLGGLTGDTLGAVGECTEAAALAAASWAVIR